MTIDNFINIIEQEFPDVPKGKLNSESHYKEVNGLTSINALILIALIDNAYDVILTADDIKSTTTLNELLLVVKKSKFNNK